LLDTALKVVSQTFEEQKQSGAGALPNKNDRTAWGPAVVEGTTAALPVVIFGRTGLVNQHCAILTIG
jgi:hypothetical protein